MITAYLCVKLLDVEVHKSHIDDVFNTKRRIEIPFFQRVYVWGEDKWERFLDDIENVSKSENKGYFMGPLILKAKATSSKEDFGDVRELIDGQQRLTTISILFKALYELQGLNDKYKQDFFTNDRRFHIMDHNYNDRAVFNDIVFGRLEGKSKAASDNNIERLYYWCTEKQNARIKKLNAQAILRNVYFAVMDLQSGEDEQEIFDTINSIGVQLTTADLLKNELFSKGDKPFYEQTWRKTFELDSDVKHFWDEEVVKWGYLKRHAIDLLLQSFLIYKNGGELKYARVEKLFQHYKNHLKKVGDKRHFVNEMMKFAETYRNNVQSPEAEELNSAIKRLMLIVFVSPITTVIPYVLYVLSNLKDEQEQSKIFSLLENYLVRRFVIKANTRNYDEIFANLVKQEILNRDDLASHLTDELRPDYRMPTDDAVREFFCDNEKRKPFGKITRIVLYLMETKLNDNPIYALRPKPFTAYSLEHIMPRSWKTNWHLSNDTEFASKERDEKVNCWGNLVIIPTRLNLEISNSSWKDKVSGQNGKGGLAEYARGLKTFPDEFLDRDVWDESAIDDRGKFLYELAIQVWEYPKL